MKLRRDAHSDVVPSKNSSGELDYFFSTLVLSQQAFTESPLQQALVESFLQQAFAESPAQQASVLVASTFSLLAAFLPPQEVTESEKATASIAKNTFVFIFLIALNV
jgi:hypothetical protein